jgi:hypothetical protein
VRCDRRTLNILDRALDAARAQRVALFDEIEQRAVIPLVAKTAILGRFDHRLRRIHEALWCAATASRQSFHSDICASTSRAGSAIIRAVISKRGADRRRVGQADAVVR